MGRGWRQYRYYNRLYRRYVNQRLTSSLRYMMIGVSASLSKKQTHDKKMISMLGRG